MNESVVAGVETALSDEVHLHEARGGVRKLPIVGMDREVGFIRTKVVNFPRASVLIRGETGTGKDLLAQEIHDATHQEHKKPFIVVSCPSITADNQDIILFGQKSAGSGRTRHKGIFEQAEEGTLFLDEVADLSPAAQEKIMGVLNSGCVQPYGLSTEMEIPIRCRVVAATSRDLDALVRDGKFRADLLSKLGTISVIPPPLRNRKAEIPALVRLFIARHGADKVIRAEEDVIRTLEEYPWPGNVRELESTIEGACVLTDTESIRLQDLPGNIHDTGSRPRKNGSVGSIQVLVTGAIETALSNVNLRLENARSGGGGDLLEAARRSVEMELLKKALAETRGNKTAAAELLGITLRAIRYKIYEYGLAGRD
ncbi:MAG: sigma 54-interacting transcriptional regulator [Patescibacteria group bacterium]